MHWKQKKNRDWKYAIYFHCFLCFHSYSFVYPSNYTITMSSYFAPLPLSTPHSRASNSTTALSISLSLFSILISISNRASSWNWSHRTWCERNQNNHFLQIQRQETNCKSIFIGPTTFSDHHDSVSIGHRKGPSHNTARQNAQIRLGEKRIPSRFPCISF